MTISNACSPPGLLCQWDDRRVFFDAGVLDQAGRERLTAHGVPVVDGKVTGLVVQDNQLVGVRLADGTVVARAALFVPPRFVPNVPCWAVSAASGTTTAGTGGPERADQRAGRLGGRQRGGFRRSGDDRGGGLGREQARW